MSKNRIEIGYEDYLAFNPKGTLSKFGYVWLVIQGGEITHDFLMCFTGFFNPEIFQRDGEFFVRENFEESRYQEYLDRGESAVNSSYWLNLVEVTSFFEALSFEEARTLADAIASCWIAKLNRTFPNSGFTAKVLLEEEFDEVYVTLCKDG